MGFHWQMPRRFSTDLYQRPSLPLRTLSQYLFAGSGGEGRSRYFFSLECDFLSAVVRRRDKRDERIERRRDERDERMERLREDRDGRLDCRRDGTRLRDLLPGIVYVLGTNG